MMLLLFWLIIYVLPGSIPDPFHGFMKWIWIRPNDTDSAGSGSGSTTLHCKELYKKIKIHNNKNIREKLPIFSNF